MDREAWWATAHRVTEWKTTEVTQQTHAKSIGMLNVNQKLLKGRVVEMVLETGDMREGWMVLSIEQDDCPKSNWRHGNGETGGDE